MRASGTGSPPQHLQLAFGDGSGPVEQGARLHQANFVGAEYQRFRPRGLVRMLIVILCGATERQGQYEA